MDLSTSEIDRAKQCTFLAWCVTCSDLYFLKFIIFIIFINYKSILLQLCPISAFGLQRGERDR